VVFVAWLVLLLAGDTGAFLYGVPTSARVLFLLPVAAVGLALAAAVVTATAWREASVGVVARSGQVVLLTGLVCFTWFVMQWNMFGWHFG
jgi:hypothetical protein